MIQRLLQDFKRSVWLILTLIAVVLAARWILSRGKAERLFDMPAGDTWLIGVRGGEAIFLSTEHGPKVQVLARSLNSGKTRLVGEDAGLLNGFLILLTDNALYYKTLSTGNEPPAARRVSRAEGASPSVARPSAAGGRPAVLRPVLPNPRLPGTRPPYPIIRPKMATHFVANMVWPLEGVGDVPGYSPSEYRSKPSPAWIRRLSLRDGEWNDVALPVVRHPFGQRDYAALGDSVYVTQFVPDPPARPTDPLRKRKPCTVELLRCPVTGGRPTLLRRAPGITSCLYANDGYLFWIIARPDDPTRVDLYYRKDGAQELKCVKDFQSWFPPLIAGDRLYWITRIYARQDPKSPAIVAQSSNLVTSGLDGQDRRVIEPLIKDGEVIWYVNRPLVHGDRIFVQVTEQSGQSEAFRRKETVYRVKGDLSGLEHVLDLPANTSRRASFIEGDWLYFGIASQRQHLMDYFRNEDKLDYEETLYRLPAPR